MYFIDRRDAGQKLAEALYKYSESNAVVYALPRGGVPLGAEISRILKLPLDLIITRKIGYPMNYEFAVCATTEEGDLLCNEEIKSTLDQEWLKRAIQKEQDEARRRRHVYLQDKDHISATGKTAIIVDDGIATGLTIRTAVRSIRKENPKKIIVAVPVAPGEVIKLLQNEADEVIVLEGETEYLGFVSVYYDSFPQVSDEEVINLLAEVTTYYSNK